MIAASSLEAQQIQALRVGLTAERNAVGLTATRRKIAAPDTGTTSRRPEHVLKGALVGAAVGAATGLVAAMIVNYRRSHMHYLDHSEDGIEYFFLPITGMGVGILVGSIVGFAWR
jgi:hypothetical protein